MSNRAQISARDNFIEQMGLITQADGAPRIAGRIFGMLIVEGRPAPLSEMVERLQISRASASTNARMLANRGLLRLTSMPGDRQDYYELASGTPHQLLEAVGIRMRKSADQIAEAEEKFGDDDAEARERVHQFAQFYRRFADFITASADQAKS